MQGTDRLERRGRRVAGQGGRGRQSGRRRCVECLPRGLPADARRRRHVRRVPGGSQIEAVRLQGRSAAEQGVPVGRGVDLYLSAARRVWAELPAVIRERDSAAVRAAAAAVLQVVDDAVASFADGHAEAGREMIRREETLRRELVDDLLRGDAHLASWWDAPNRSAST